jgi:hypothetical protein
MAVTNLHHLTGHDPYPRDRSALNVLRAALPADTAACVLRCVRTAWLGLPSVLPLGRRTLASSWVPRPKGTSLAWVLWMGLGSRRSDASEVARSRTGREGD